jgi:hypothetical protein
MTQISPDTLLAIPDTEIFHRMWYKIVIGYRKLKFLLPPADPGTREANMPCPFLLVLDFSL